MKDSTLFWCLVVPKKASNNADGKPTSRVVSNYHIIA